MQAHAHGTTHELSIAKQVRVQAKPASRHQLDSFTSVAYSRSLSTLAFTSWHRIGTRQPAPSAGSA